MSTSGNVAAPYIRMGVSVIDMPRCSYSGSPTSLKMPRAFCIVLLASLIVPGALYGMALAYIDPLSGSVLLQVIAAGVLGAIFSTKSFLAKVRVAARAAWSKLTRK